MLKLPSSFLRTLFLTLLLLTSALGGVQASQTIRLLSWNMKWFPGGSPTATEEQKQAQMAAAQAAIKALHPDIVLLQEVADYDAVKQLVSVLPGFKVDIVSHFPSRPQNVAIASRFLADSAWAEEWKRNGIDDPPRGYGFAAIHLPNNRLLLAYSMHLKSNLGDMAEDIAMRQEAVRQLLPHAKAMLDLYSKRAETALIIGGDFNTSLEGTQFKSEKTLTALREAGLSWSHEGIPPKERITIPKAKGRPGETIDHIFSMGFGKPVAKVVPIENVSDHNPVILDINIDEHSPVALHPEKAQLPTTEVIPIKVEPATTEAVFTPTDKKNLISMVGKKAIVRGTVSSIARVGKGSIALLNFAATQRGDFVAVIKRPYIRGIGLNHGGSLSQLRGREIEVTGIVSNRKNVPQIELTNADQIKVTR